jgi:hypothetical protein
VLVPICFPRRSKTPQRCSLVRTVAGVSALTTEALCARSGIDSTSRAMAACDSTSVVGTSDTKAMTAT